jgi:hypothetical protein
MGIVVVENPLIRLDFGSLLVVSHLIFNPSAARLVLSPHCICPSRFWLSTSIVIIHISMPFLEPPMSFKNTRFLISVFKHKPMLVGITFNWRIYQSSYKTWCPSAAPDSCHSFSANSIPWTCTISSAARKWTTPLVCSSCKDKLEYIQTCLGIRVCLTQHPSDTLWPFRELNYRTSYSKK